MSEDLSLPQLDENQLSEMGESLPYVDIYPSLVYLKLKCRLQQSKLLFIPGNIIMSNTIMSFSAPIPMASLKIPLKNIQTAYFWKDDPTNEHITLLIVTDKKKYRFTKLKKSDSFLLALSAFGVPVIVGHESLLKDGSASGSATPALSRSLSGATDAQLKMDHSQWRTGSSSGLTAALRSATRQCFPPARRDPGDRGVTWLRRLTRKSERDKIATTGNLNSAISAPHLENLIEVRQRLPYSETQSHFEGFSRSLNASQDSASDSFPNLLCPPSRTTIDDKSIPSGISSPELASEHPVSNSNDITSTPVTNGSASSKGAQLTGEENDSDLEHSAYPPNALFRIVAFVMAHKAPVIAFMVLFLILHHVHDLYSRIHTLHSRLTEANSRMSRIQARTDSLRDPVDLSLSAEEFVVEQLKPLFEKWLSLVHHAMSLDIPDTSSVVL